MRSFLRLVPVCFFWSYFAVSAKIIAEISYELPASVWVHVNGSNSPCMSHSWVMRWRTFSQVKPRSITPCDGSTSHLSRV